MEQNEAREVGDQRMRVITQEHGPSIQEEGRRAMKRPNPVWMVQLDADARVQTTEGMLTGKAGDFVAYDPISGHVWPVQASYVEQHYDFTDAAE